SIIALHPLNCAIREIWVTTRPTASRRRPISTISSGTWPGSSTKNAHERPPDHPAGATVQVGRVLRCLSPEWQAGYFMDLTFSTGGSMKIGILGSGIVAQTLGAGFLDHGYQVMMGTREPAKLADWHKQNSKATIGDFAATAGFAEVAVLAVKGTAAKAALEHTGSELKGKIVIDATNPISDAPPVNGVLRFSTTLDESL